MEAPVDSDTEEGSDESFEVPTDLEDEVDINIHFHCEHCFKLRQCQERPRPGWCCDVQYCVNGCGHSCDVQYCVNGCGHRFHMCKTDEHLLMCSHERVPCINAGYGCPQWMQRRYLSQHLPFCPASVIICNTEWNRWALGAKEREKVAMSKSIYTLYDGKDLDMALALHDQELVNEMQKLPKRVRTTLCNGITRRFPCLPLTVRGSRHVLPRQQHNHSNSISEGKSHTEEEDDDLTPGLSVSVCAELVRGKRQQSGSGVGGSGSGSGVGGSGEGPATPATTTPSTTTTTTTTTTTDSQHYHVFDKDSVCRHNLVPAKDDIAAICCQHEIIKSICIFCRDDPDEPDYKMGKVWREHLSGSKSPGEVKWTVESCVEKVRKRNPFGMFTYKRVEDESDDSDGGDGAGDGTLDKMDLILDQDGRPVGRRTRFQTPPPAPLTPGGLTMELGIKRYSRHQTKRKAMFTFQCMQEVRRSEYNSHYQNVHSEIQEGLEGWLIHRCPLHHLGCPYVYTRLHPGHTDGDIVYSEHLHAFGVRPRLQHEPATCGGLPRSRSPSLDKSAGSMSQLRLSSSRKPRGKTHHLAQQQQSEEQFLASSLSLTFLPIEVLIKIASYLDGFSMNNLSLCCRLMRDVCLSLLNERGLVIIEWVRHIEDNKVRWKEGRKRRFFSKAFEHINTWGFKDVPHISNHLKVCPFNNRHIAKEKFAYVQPRKDGTIQGLLRNNCKT
ncbi:hypothetical protein Pmani_032125 [Petrolisthes manimaculis]|uniref:F-box only protein 30 n=1 Tax=Petrolisthes manimaculis TaxID=1843537 RepID=A0AAE1NSC6_9EUCA|nr:hypothetical protein Pmani_032125 [Petrolisthes manimaculis]